MASFPRTEAKIGEMAQIMAHGLESAPDDFPRPPIVPQELQALSEAFEDALSAVAAARAELGERRAEKKAAQLRLVAALKANIAYAEYAVGDSEEKLTLVGWAPRRPRKRLQAPGEVRDMRIVEEGDTWIALAWDTPEDGGAPAVYTIQRRAGPEAAWEDVETGGEKECRLTDQPRGVELSYRVMAINGAGSGNPSATVTAVL